MSKENIVYNEREYNAQVIKEVGCDECNAGIGQYCTQADDAVTWVYDALHSSRVSAFNKLKTILNQTVHFGCGLEATNTACGLPLNGANVWSHRVTDINCPNCKNTLEPDKKRFVFVMALNHRVEWSGKETREHLLTTRFPPSDTEHNDVKRFCDSAKRGSYIKTNYNMIFCVEDGTQ